MPRFFSLAALFLSLLSFPAIVRAEEGVYFHHTGEQRYKSKVFCESDSFGYSPRTLPANAWGHIPTPPKRLVTIFWGNLPSGVTMSTAPSVTYINEVQALDPTRVLVSAPPRQVFIEDPVFTQTATDAGPSRQDQ